MADGPGPTRSPRPRLARVTPEELSAAIRTALDRGRRRWRPRGGRARGGARGATEEPRPRRLVHQRRPAAGQARRYAAARRRGRARRAPRPGRRGQGRRHRRARVPQHHPGRRVRRRAGPQPSSRRVRPTAATTPRPATSINLEFISANPTGPLHLGHTRWAALGDAMRRLLVASGADVTAEYYINDAGAQMDKFARVGAGPGQGRADARGRLPGRLHRRPGRAQVLAERPDLLDLPTDEALADGPARSATPPS